MKRGGFKAALVVFSTLLAAATSAHADPGWNLLVSRVLQQPEPARVEVINSVINEIDHVPNPGIWLTPAELLARGEGDCKDLALAKFLLLRQSGQTREKVRLGYGDTTLGNDKRLHLVVLLWVDDNSPLVLDNLLPGVHRLNDRRDLDIRFSFDEQNFYAGTGADRIRNQPIKGWQHLLTRVTVPDVGRTVAPAQL